MFHIFLLGIAFTCRAGTLGLGVLAIKWHSMTDVHMRLLFVMGMLTLVVSLAAGLTK